MGEVQARGGSAWAAIVHAVGCGAISGTAGCTTTSVTDCIVGVVSSTVSCAVSRVVSGTDSYAVGRTVGRAANRAFSRTVSLANRCAADNAVRLLQGMLRTNLLSLERQIQARIPLGHPFLAWLVSHAATIKTMRVKGRTAEQPISGPEKRHRQSVCCLSARYVGTSAAHRRRS